MIPRGAWGPKEYAEATGRGSETVEVLKAQVTRGGLKMERAREIAVAQGIDPDRIGAVVDVFEPVVQMLKSFVLLKSLTLEQARVAAQSQGLDPDRVGKVVASVAPITEAVA